jgi:hypothetical protein
MTFGLRRAFHAPEIIGRKRPRLRIAHGGGTVPRAAHGVLPIVTRRLSRCLRAKAILAIVLAVVGLPNGDEVWEEIAGRIDTVPGIVAGAFPLVPVQSRRHP